jgi:hypothetical protein
MQQITPDQLQDTRDRLAAYLRESATVTQQQAEGLNALADYVSSLDDNDGAIRRLTEIRLDGNHDVAALAVLGSDAPGALVGWDPESDTQLGQVLLAFVNQIDLELGQPGQAS